MTLGDMENACLIELQQPGAINLPAAPNWAALTNPQFSQAVVDFYINAGYLRVASDLGEYDLMNVSAIIPTVAQQVTYTIDPPAPYGGAVYPRMRMLRRVFYAPHGAGYTQEYRPGGDLISWDEFQRYTQQGYLMSTSFGTQPGKVAVTPDRKLAIFVGPAASGDLMTIEYAPLPTAGATICPTLKLAADVPLGPADAHEAIVQWALSKLWLRTRQAGMANAARQAYELEIARLRDLYGRKSAGDGWSFQDRDAFPGTMGSAGGLW